MKYNQTTFIIHIQGLIFSDRYSSTNYLFCSTNIGSSFVLERPIFEAREAIYFQTHFGKFGIVKSNVHHFEFLNFYRQIAEFLEMCIFQTPAFWNFTITSILLFLLRPQRFTKEKLWIFYLFL